MYDLYSYPGLFAAYNAGPERYGEYLRHGRSLPAETRTYLATVDQIDPGSLPSPSVASGTRLFFTLRTTANAPSGRDDRKSVVSGTRVPVRVDRGGRRIIKKKRKTKISHRRT